MKSIWMYKANESLFRSVNSLLASMVQREKYKKIFIRMAKAEQAFCEKPNENDKHRLVYVYLS